MNTEKENKEKQNAIERQAAQHSPDTNIWDVFKHLFMWH